MEKEEYEKSISWGSDGKSEVFRHFIVVTPKLLELLEKYGENCSRCSQPFIPQPHWRKNYPTAPHYPTEKICGFCVYDMDSYQHSMVLDEEDYYPI